MPASPKKNVEPPQREASIDSKTLDSSFEAIPDLPTWRKVILICTVTLGFITSNLSLLAINIALPTIQRELNISTGDLQWLSGAYTLTYGSTLLLWGRLSDIFGHKKTFLAGLIWFLAWTLACALAPNAIALFIFRAFMGIGTAIVSPSMFGILGRSFRTGSRWKTFAFAAFSAGAPLGGALGLVAGGVMTQLTKITWRSFFYLNVGLAGAVGLAALAIIPNDPPRSAGDPNRRVDWIGAALIVSGLTLFTFAMADSSAAPDGWKTPYIPTLLAVGLILIAIFIWWEARMERNEGQGRTPPLMRLSLFRRGRFAAVQVVATCLWVAFVDLNFFFTQYFQTYLKLTPIQTLVRFLPMPVVGVLLNVTFGLFANRIPGQVLMVIGCVFTSISCLLCAVMNPSASYWTYNFFSNTLTVFGADFVFATASMYGSKVARASEQAVAGGTFLTMTQCGSVIGLAICTIVQVNVTQRESRKDGVDVTYDLDGAPPEAYLKGLRGAFWTCFAFGAFAAALGVVLLRGVGIVGGEGSSKRKASDPEAAPPKSNTEPAAAAEAEVKGRGQEKDDGVEEKTPRQSESPA